MGEMADLIINGGMCQYCGNCFNDECGYPRNCLDCDIEDEQPAKPVKVKCTECGKMVAESGLSQHVTAKHQRNDSNDK